MNPKIEAKIKEVRGNRLEIEVASKAISIDEIKHTATFVMSTGTIDRHGDIVEQDSWVLDHFLENPAFFWGHRSNDFPLGKWLSVELQDNPEREGEKMLVGTAEFAVEVHDEIMRAWNHVKRGDLNMVSVGFIPRIVDYDEDRDAFVLKNCELLECSLVGIGANRQALIKDAEEVKRDLIDAKVTLQKQLDQGDPTATRKLHAITLLDKAIRQLKK